MCPASLLSQRLASGVGNIALTAATAGLLVAGFTAHAEYVPAPGYRSVEVLSFEQVSAVVTATDAGILAKLSALRFSYADLVKTAVITEPVAERTGLTADAVSSALGAVAPPASFLLEVEATLPTAQDAQRLAAAASDEVVQYAAAQQDHAAIPADQQFDIVVATPATLGVRLPSHLRRAVAAGVLVFVLTSLVVLAAFVAAGVVVRRRRSVP